MGGLIHIEKPIDDTVVDTNTLSKDELLKEMMEKYGQNVTRLAFTYVKDQAAAEDIAQEVFIKCYKKLDQFQGKSSLRAWIYRITVNYCKDYLKSWSYRHIRVSNMITSLTKENVSSPELELINQSEHERLANHILSLPVKYREVILLYYYEELSVAEIGTLLSVREQTVRTRLFRARKLLRKLSF